MVVEKIGTSALKVPRNRIEIESLFVATDPCVTRVAYSNSGQPMPQLRGVQIPPQQPKHRGGVGTTGPTPRAGRGGTGKDTMECGGKGVVTALHHNPFTLSPKSPKPLKALKVLQALNPTLPCICLNPKPFNTLTLSPQP